MHDDADVEAKLLSEVAMPDITSGEMFRWNKPEWGLIFIGVIASIVLGVVYPAFSILTSEIVGVSKDVILRSMHRNCSEIFCFLQQAATNINLLLLLNWRTQHAKVKMLKLKCQMLKCKCLMSNICWRTFCQKEYFVSTMSMSNWYVQLYSHALRANSFACDYNPFLQRSHSMSHVDR